MDEDFVALELSLLASNIKKEVCGMLDYLILSFLEDIEKEKLKHAFIDIRFTIKKFSFGVCEQNISIVEEYDKKSLHSILLKHYHYLHLLVDCEIGFVN